MTENQIMDRPIKVWEFVMAIVGLFITVGMIIYDRGTMDSRTQMQINVLQEQIHDVRETQKEQYRMINDKLDKNQQSINDVLIIIQNKQDKK